MKPQDATAPQTQRPEVVLRPRRTSAEIEARQLETARPSCLSPFQFRRASLEKSLRLCATGSCLTSNGWRVVRNQVRSSRKNLRCFLLLFVELRPPLLLRIRDTLTRSGTHMPSGGCDGRRVLGGRNAASTELAA